MDYKLKLEQFCKLVTQNLAQAHAASGYSFAPPVTQVKSGSKYDRVDIVSPGSNSGRYMVEVRTGNIFGIKGYGTPHKGHWYGTLDTVADYFWGNYYPEKLDGSLARQKANNVPVITHAPTE